MTDNTKKPLTTIISVASFIVACSSAFFSYQSNKFSEQSNAIANKAYDLSEKSQKEGGVIVKTLTKVAVTSEKYHGNTNDKIALTFFIDNQDNKTYELEDSYLIINSHEGGEKTTLKANLSLPNNYKQVDYLSNKSKINEKFSPLSQSSSMNGFNLTKRESSQITIVYFDQSTFFRIPQKVESSVYSAKLVAKINGQEKTKDFCFEIQPNLKNERFALKDAPVKDCLSSNAEPFPDLPQEREP